MISGVGSNWLLHYPTGCSPREKQILQVQPNKTAKTAGITLILPQRHRNNNALPERGPVMTGQLDIQELVIVVAAHSEEYVCTSWLPGEDCMHRLESWRQTAPPPRRLLYHAFHEPVSNHTHTFSHSKQHRFTYTWYHIHAIGIGKLTYYITLHYNSLHNNRCDMPSETYSN